MRSTTEFVAPPEGVSPAEPPPRLLPREFTMSTPTMIRVARREIKLKAATRERNIPQSSLRDVSMEFIVSFTRRKAHPSNVVVVGRSPLAPGELAGPSAPGITGFNCAGIAYVLSV